ncbi:MAG: hypothetical protein LC800_02805 [Acidobacteria bacterium]|nr:hypothetical protein [Acidobacteriota bacterium]
MTRKVFAVSLMLLLAVFAVAQDGNKTIKVKGHLIDNMCAGEPGEDKDYEDEAKGHTLSCALMPHCHKTGFAVAEGRKLYKLDAAGNKLAGGVLKATKAAKTQKGLLVEVEGTLEGTTLKATKLTEVVAQ